MNGKDQPVLVRLSKAKYYVLPLVHYVLGCMIHELQTALIVRLRKLVDLCKPSYMRLKWKVARRVMHAWLSAPVK